MIKACVMHGQPFSALRENTLFSKFHIKAPGCLKARVKFEETIVYVCFTHGMKRFGETGSCSLLLYGGSCHCSGWLLAWLCANV